MNVNIKKLFQIANPSRTLDLTNLEDQKYYIDFSEVRGSNLISKLRRTIELSENQPTCQLFTGHIGCGKSTELSNLRAKLQDKNYHVVYFESSQDLDMGDVDISDILLVIAQQITKSLENAEIRLQPTRFRKLIHEAVILLNSEVTGLKLKIPGLKEDIGQIGMTQEEDKFSLSLGIAEITAKAKDSKNIRSLLRQHFEPRVKIILEALNEEVIQPALKQLNEKNKSGLVVIIDNLDRIDNREKVAGRNQPEYLFVDRGEHLNKIKCHVIYTIPPVLTFSNEQENLRNRFGCDPYILPMVRVYERDGDPCTEGLALMQQLILALAFPDLSKQERLKSVSELFEDLNTLNYICQISGGHVRNLLVLFHSCLKEVDPPFTQSLVEKVVKQRRNDLNRAITSDEWKLLKEVEKKPSIRGEEEFKVLLRSLFVFEYQDENQCWFAINPVLHDAPELKEL